MRGIVLLLERWLGNLLARLSPSSVYDLELRAAVMQDINLWLLTDALGGVEGIQ